MKTTTCQTHIWIRVPNTGFGLKHCECGMYQGAVYVPRRRLLTNQNRKRLEEILMEIKTQYKNGFFGVAAVQKHSTRFHAILDGYLNEWVTQPGRNTQTIKNQIAGFKREMADPTVRAMNEPTDPAYNLVGDWVKKYLARAKPQSARRKFSTIRAALNWGIQKGLLRDNPCDRVRLPEIIEPLPRFLSKEEIARLLEASPRQEFSDYCELILRTGLRPNEALGLLVEHIHIERGMISGFKQKDKRRLGAVPITKKLVPLLERLIDGRVSGSLLGYTTAMLRNDADEAIAKAGINQTVKPGTSPFTIYGLRHTFASHLLMAGESMTTVARWLRNSVVICDKYYGHLTQDFLRDAGERMDLL